MKNNGKEYKVHHICYKDIARLSSSKENNSACPMYQVCIM